MPQLILFGLNVLRRVVRGGRPCVSAEHRRGVRVHRAVTSTTDYLQRRWSRQRPVSST